MLGERPICNNGIRMLFVFVVATVVINEGFGQETCEDLSSSCSSLASLCGGNVFQYFLTTECRMTCGFCTTPTTETTAKWSSWRDLKPCSVTCGGGCKVMKRRCRGGRSCIGRRRKKVPCNTHACTEIWGEWAQVEGCSRTCGGGFVFQTRTCQTESCIGETFRKVSCQIQNCPISILSLSVSSWSVWSSWSACSATCGRGEQRRFRLCNGTSQCDGDDMEKKTCLSSTAVCPCTCAADASCVDDLPFFCSFYMTADTCNSSSSLANNCQKKCGMCDKCSCGTWSEWKTSECSRSCGIGLQYRTRTCPVGRTCNGAAQITLTCNKGDCDILSNWEQWMSWSGCSVTCGVGTQRRSRNCPGSCQGPSLQVKECKLEVCPALLGHWSSCSRTCDWGTRTRQRCYLCSIDYEDCKVQDCLQEKCVSPFQSRYSTQNYSCCNASDSLATSCGISTKTSGRIVGGSASSIGAWPWMVQIELARQLCGGNLITNKLVVTAAHCFRSKEYNSFTLRFGASIFRDSSVHVQVREERKENVFLHPGENVKDDIAIIKLNQSVFIGGNYVRPICLPQGETVLDDIQCVAAGWGVVSPLLGSGFPSVNLQEVHLRTLPFAVCKQAYSNDATSPEKLICAGRISGGVDTCKGDSGGPLMCQRCSSCAWFLAGITSFGSGVCGSRESPGIYTRISGYGAWIDLIAGENITSGSYSSCPD